MKPFDERFADRVREVFDKHDEPFDPGAWEAMQSTLGQNSPATRQLMPWLLRIAAALLLIISFSVLLIRPERDEIAETAGTDTAFAEEDATAPSRDPEEHEPLAGDPVDPVVKDTPTMPDPAGDTVDRDLADTSSHPTAIAAETPVRDTSDAVPGTTQPRIAHAAAIPQPTPADTLSGTADALIAHDAAVPDIIPADAAPATRETLTADAVIPAYGLPVDEPAESRALRWGVAAGPMLTYAEQQLASGIGFSAGASSEYRLSRQFTVKSGLLLAYQQFEVDNMPLRSRSFLYKDYATGPEETGYMAQQAYSNQSFEIMALDIPVNIQYQLMETARRQIYIEAGFSSLLYLQQKITGEEIAYVDQAYYSPADGTYRQLSSRVRSDVTASYGPFSQFDPARLLNLSFGYTISGGNNTTIIEPFIKYPLGDLGSRQIRMGMGGINLRIRFGE